MANQLSHEVWLVYDGECPICNATANALKIRDAVGTLHLINARMEHPILLEIKKAGFNLDDGMVVKFNSTLYHGADAQHVLAMIGTRSDWFNSMNVWLFRSKFLAKLLYPMMRSGRNTFLRIKGIRKLNNLQFDSTQPIFAEILKTWDELPNVFKLRYANRPFTDDVVTAKGELNVMYSRTFSIFLPILRLFKLLVPYQGNDIPVTVNFKSQNDSENILFERTFYFPDKSPYQFNSYLQTIKNNVIVEFIRAGIGVRMKCLYLDGKIIFQHNGYVCKIFGKNIPLPLSLFLGKIYAEETAVSDDSFSMLMQITNPIFGKIFEYHGIFTITNNHE